eukprot:4278-Pelagomonas_calceolata.AAC.7
MPADLPCACCRHRRGVHLGWPHVCPGWVRLGRRGVRFRHAPHVQAAHHAPHLASCCLLLGPRDHGYGSRIGAWRHGSRLCLDALPRCDRSAQQSHQQQQQQ